MKKYLSFFFAFVLCTHLINAQVITSKFSGDWKEDGVDNIFRFSNGKVMLFYLKGKGEGYQTAKEYCAGTSSSDFIESYHVNKNNALYSWTNTCIGCGWTETHIYHFSYVTDQLIRVHFSRIVNNIGGCTNPENSWHSDAKSFIKTSEFDIEPRSVSSKDITEVGGASNSGISILNISTSQKDTKIIFKLTNNTSQNQSYTLNAPGSEKAFFLIDQDGVKYKLIGQFGFGGFDHITIPSYETLVFQCYFEKLPASTKMINIKEGNCSGSNCWNFYEVSLQ